MDSIRTDPKATILAAIQATQKARFPPGSMPRRLTAFWLLLHCHQFWIRDIHEKTVPLIPNRAQCMVLATCFAQALLGRPIRIVILKARKLGVTTIVQTWNYFNCRYFSSQHAVTMAHQGDATEEIFKIARTVGMHDMLTGPPKIGLHRLTFPNMSSYHCQTAGGESAGAGGTPNLLHRSELALWRRTKKVENDYASGNAVPKTPTSCIFDESTARGQDLFWGRFQAAQRPDHPFERVFVPWFVDETLRSPLPTTFVIDDDEGILMRRAEQEYGIKVPLEALQWRREKIRELGRPEIFCQEYPSTPEEAIAAVKGHVLPGLSECVIDELPFTYGQIPNRQKRGGWDHGFHDPAALVSAVWRDQTLYVIDVHRARSELARQQARHVLAGHTYYCDPAALSARRELAKASNEIGTGASFVKAPRRAGEPGKSVVAAEWEMVVTLIREGRLFILASAAAQLLIEAESFFYGDNSGEPDQHRNLEECGHFDTCDALRYCVMGCERDAEVVEPEPAVELSRRDAFRL
jgi:hypothetical protein